MAQHQSNRHTIEAAETGTHPRQNITPLTPEARILQRTLNIVHVIRQFHPSTGGMEDVVRNTALAQHQAGHKVRIVTLDRLFRSGIQLPSTDSLAGIPVLRIPFSGSERYPIAPSVSRYIDGADLVHVHGIDFFFDYFALKSLNPTFRPKLVASTHGGFFHTQFASGPKVLYLHSITRLSASRYDRIFASSDADADTFSKVVSPTRLVTVENGVDIDKFRGLACRQQRKSILSIGRWSANKCVLKTVDLLKSLRETDKEWKLTLCGRPFDQSAAEILQYAKTQGVMDSISVKVDQSDEELRQEIREASYFISLSTHEGFGLAAVEAMSAGLVPLLSDIAPYRKLCSQFPAGQLRTLPNDMKSAAAIVRQLQALDADDHQSIVRSAMEIANSYGWKKASARFIDEYMQLFAHST